MAVGSMYGYVRYRLNSIHTISNLPLSNRTVPGGSSADGLSPMNILLVGDNSRVGLSPSEAAQFGTTDEAGGAHSDVTMVLHLDPATGRAALLSIPRDLFVPLPPNNITGDVGKIDSALNGSNYQYSDGAAQLITTIQNDLGIPITNYVEINFDGFQQTINDLGGIDMYFPDELFDVDAALRIARTGCIQLNGATALALVRARHLQYYAPGYNPSDPHSWPQEQESDLARIQRTHTFLKVLSATVTSQGITTNLVKLNDLLGDVISQVTVDSGLKSELIPVIRRFRAVNLNNVPELTLPVSVVPDVQYSFDGGVYGQVDFPVEPADQQVVAEWQNGAIAKASPSSITVDVQNISNVSHEAADTVASLAQLGFNAVDVGQGSVPADNVETMVHYNPGPTGLDQAETVVAALGGSVMMQSDPTVSAGTVMLDTGTAVDVLSPASATPSSGSSTQVATTTTVPTPDGQPVSSSTDKPLPWDPSACTSGQAVVSNT